VPSLSIFATRAEAKAFAKRYDLDGVPQRPLAEKTLRRIARGMQKFVLVPDPFIVPLRGSGDTHGASHSIREPLSTVSAQGTHHALVAPVLINTRNGERQGQAPRVFDIRAPYPTITAQGSQGGLVTAFLARHFGRRGTPGNDLRGPIGTITARDHTSLVTAQLGLPFGVRERTAEVRAFLMAYYGSEQTQSVLSPLATVTTKDRFGLVTVANDDHAITDIAMRMLQRASSSTRRASAPTT
jgi:DNA (cytosine-5)-methyltransferase 1